MVVAMIRDGDGSESVFAVTDNQMYVIKPSLMPDIIVFLKKKTIFGYFTREQNFMLQQTVHIKVL